MDTNYEPLFSIIIPTLNSGKTISASIQSVLAQSFHHYELLVIDSLSTDDTLSIVNSFNTGQIKIISEKDKGIYDAMNKGIRLAKGKWLYFLGSDDMLYDDAVLLNISHVINTHPKANIVFGDVFTSGNTIERFTNYGFVELLDRCICQQAIFYRRSLFENMLFNLQYKVCSDWDFNMQVFIPKNHPVYIKQLIANYSLEGASGKWQEHPEYLNYFSDKKDVIIRYKGRQNLYFYYAWYYTKRYARKINAKLTWMFQ